ncbi:MAG: phosphoribosylamine--glycine ligase [Candidatus Hydrogenedentes bacterium]|nr:phosphoribosylamine--glycine ligase [Candidatus Hydrogenedentota bacterium]
MKVLVIGSGGREHALAWKIAQSEGVEQVFAAPGNPGIARLEKGRCIGITPSAFKDLEAFIAQEGIGLTVVGPEDPLAAGIVDRLSGAGHVVFGPTAAAARLEASKSFAKDFMARHEIPTAEHAVFTTAEPAILYVRKRGLPIVVKADGLAAGKGVTVARTLEDAEQAIWSIMVHRTFGEAGARVVIEDFLEGEEASILAFSDGRTVVAMPSSQDHKAAFDHDQGPNTGGMGAYSPAPVVSREMLPRIEQDILRRCVDGMAADGTPYTGVLYAGLMMTMDGPKVVEFNCRFGDPETQVVLPRMRSDLVPALLACCNGTLDMTPIEYDDGACVTVVMASGGYPGPYEKGKEISGLAEAEADPDVTVFHAGTKHGENGRLLTNGGRVLNVTARGKDLRQTIGKAYGAVKKIQFDGAHFRRDIGQKALNRP